MVPHKLEFPGFLSFAFSGLAQTRISWISELFCFLVSHKLGLPGFLRFVLSWSRANLGFLDFWDPRLYQNVSVKGVDCVHALSKEVLNRRGITRRQLTARSRAHASIRAASSPLAHEPTRRFAHVEMPRLFRFVLNKAWPQPMPFPHLFRYLVDMAWDGTKIK